MAQGEGSRLLTPKLKERYVVSWRAFMLQRE
jgi:hypothetical protein